MSFRFVLSLAALVAVAAPAKHRAIPIKVVVTMFERGADTGDQPGELQYWAAREKLDRVIPFPEGYT